MGPERGKIVALVTAGYKNLGRYISLEMKKAGYKVLATYRSDEKKAEEFSDEFGIPIYPVELSEKGEVEALFAWVESNHGFAGVIVNNASSFPTGPLLSMSVESFEDAFKSSVFASNLIVKRAVGMMREMGGGRIVNIGMSGIEEISGYSNVAAHASAKTALLVLTKSWANELKKDRITVNMVSPGMIDYRWRTDAWREKMRKVAASGKLTRPEAVASAVRYLIERPDITGYDLKVDPEPSSI
ncbi:MAG: SDR family oxidoreductase [Thermoplasmatota archaeon]